MKKIAVTQRVTIVQEYGERRDCLDQRWISFLYSCNLLPIILPNNIQIAKNIMLELCVDGLLLTGGNTLYSLGGDAPERDAVEKELLRSAITNGIPVLGVCRGMQILQEFVGQTNFEKLNNHVNPNMNIMINGVATNVNSYHNFGVYGESSDWNIWAVSDDGVIKAVHHKIYPFTGIMWHPERFSLPRPDDIKLFTDVFTKHTKPILTNVLE